MFTRFFTRIAAKLGYRPLQTFTVQARLIHADGSEEDLGTVGSGKGKFDALSQGR